MRHEERLQLMWALSFIISGIIFGMAFIYTPYIGALAVAGYIVLYVGLSSAFLMVFRSMTRINDELIRTLESRKAELEEMKESARKKYLTKRIDRDAFERMGQDYEKQLTEVEAKIHGLKRI
jgi:hypothetical protein